MGIVQIAQFVFYMPCLIIPLYWYYVDGYDQCVGLTRGTLNCFLFNITMLKGFIDVYTSNYGGKGKKGKASAPNAAVKKVKKKDLFFFPRPPSPRREQPAPDFYNFLG